MGDQSRDLTAHLQPRTERACRRARSSALRSDLLRETTGGAIEAVEVT